MTKWLKNAVFYEIYPQSFKDTNGDGIGDFNGIIEKLDYIKDLGFTAIWMNPCFDSPFFDAGYDVRNYYTTASRYGTNKDIKNLFDEVHSRDLHIILDLVPGHTSVEYKWFAESQKATKNEFSDRYIWTDSIWKDCAGYPGISGSLRGIFERDGSCAINYFSSQPALNYGFAEITDSWQFSVDSEAAVQTRNELVNIIKFWLKMGCDGFRVDMAGSLVKSDPDKKETIRLWQEIFSAVKSEYPDSVFVSEWGAPDQSLLSGFDMDFLLHFGPSHYPELFRTDKPYFSHNGVGDSKAFFDYYIKCLNITKNKGFMCLPSGNHDMSRLAGALDEDEIKLAFAFIMSMPGVPFVYYGDEIGMRYIKGIKSVEGGYTRTGSRTPMQWDNGEVNCGFSEASPEDLYIAIDDSFDRPTVAAQFNNSNSILNEVKRLIQLRRQTPSLQESAEFELISTDMAYPLIYLRKDGADKILVVINPTDTEYNYDYGKNISAVIYSVNRTAVIDDSTVKIPPCSANFIAV